ncbi:uncharacterized protein LOC123565486 [Mercenaria mercenaria]|uniref:uncharacterized protein LOC123565486 n=1 Tax=Mercenaria mercenaria TaxID=6596 RepID=UPI00234E7CAE|nr:uncharacterized protein LOC123565486 [Mercenaria mercenaria]
MCQVIFEPSFKTPRNDVKPCSGVIDRCNVTGNWYQYDYALETACMSYTSEYKGFKNIHCFLCNGNTLTNEDSICERESGEHGDTSFVALLDFYDLDGTSSKSKVTKCSSGSKYDPLKKVCRPLSCAPGMMLSQDKCTPIYKEMVNPENDLVFRLQFNLLSTHATKSFQWFHLERLAELVLNEFSSKLILLYTTFSARLCDFNSYVKLEQSLENTVISMKRENLTDFMTFVHHLAIVVDFSFEEIRNTSATLEEMATLFASYDYYAQYLVQYKSGDSEMPTKYNYNASEEFESTLNELDIDMFQYYMILRGQNDPEDGLGILWLEYIFAPQQGCESTLSIQPNPFCACIELNRNEFNIDIANRRIKSGGFSHTSSLELTFSKILSSKNGEGVLVCSDEYFSQLPSESKHFPAVKDQLVVLTIICLVCSIISLLLTFVIYSMLPSLRTLPGLNNMALVFHLFLAHTLALIIAVTDIKVQWLCSAVGVLLHYTLLSSFLWMFICTFHMMTVFAKIKDRHAAVHNNKFFRYLIFTEVISALLIVSNIVVALISSKTSPGFGYGGSNCYIRDSITILLFVAVPLGLILTANFGMFAYVIWIVARLPDMAKHSNHERHNIMIFFKLSTLTGITWIFGFLYEFFEILLFAYAYIVLNAGQGVFIMFSFVLNKRVFFMLRSKSHAKKDGLSAETTRQVHVSVVSYR